MEEQIRSSSPPLPGKGYYNIDFDALEGSLSPLQTPKEIKYSPPPVRKDVDSNLEPKKETLPAKTDVAQDDNRSVSEMETIPKRKKSRSSASSKKSSGVVTGHTSHDSDAPQKTEGHVMSVDETSEKPVKHRRSGRRSKSARPMSMSYDEQLFQAEHGGERERSNSPMMKSYHEQSTPKKKHTSDDPGNQRKEVAPLQNSSNISVDPQKAPPAKEHPEPEKSSVPPEKAPSSDKNTPLPKNTPERSVSASGTESPTLQSENSAPEKMLNLGEKSPAPTKKHRARSASIASEDGSEVRSKKDKSAGKLKKSKSKKSSSGSRSDITADGNLEGTEGLEKGKERKSHRRHASHSQCDGGGVESSEPAAVEERTKSTPPTEQGQESEKSSPGSGEKSDSCMSSSHSRDSVIKLVQVLKYSQSDWNKLRQELEGHFQTQLRANDGDWSTKLAERESHVAALEEQIRKLKLTNEDMRAVMGEFEKTIGQLQAEKEKTKNATQQSLKDVVREKDQALEDLRSVETAFSDLHRRYEKTKAVLEGFKQNEDVLKKCVQDLQNKVKKAEQKTQMVREQAEDKLDRATEELEKVKKVNASEMARLEAALRKAHVQVESIEAALEQKVKENRELTAICDDLIAKVQ